MAYVNTGTEYLTVATGLSATPTHSFSFWTKITAYPSGAQTFGTYGLTGTVTSPTNGYGAETDAGTTQFLFYGNVVGGPENVLTTAQVPTSYAGWQFFFCDILSDGTLKVYYATDGGTPSLLLTTAAANQGIVANLVAFSPFGSANKAKLSTLKAWINQTFSLSDVILEAQYQSPQKSAGLLTYVSCNNGSTVGVADAGSNWTAHGTGITVDADKPAFKPPGSALFFGAGSVS